jgi:fatty-acyl-CoA synthase
VSQKISPGAGVSQTWARTLTLTADLPRKHPLGFPGVIDALADAHGSRIALQSEAACLTYRGLAEMKDCFAGWAAAQGLGRGDVVCLLMANCPAYVAIWSGIIQAGATVALINTNLRHSVLLHAITTGKPLHVIVDAAHAPALADVLPHLGPQVTCWLHGSAAPDAASLRALDHLPYAPAPSSAQARPPVLMDGTALLIFTSGTTGMPKAVRISHYRVLEWSFWFAGMMNITASDRVFDCLPMYHSTGGVSGIGAALVKGATVIIRDRFHARGFWADLAARECTVFLYIGELCRYLLAQPAAAADTQHGLRLCCGNGLQHDIWERFAARFQIPQILEFYASTEGNVSLYNVEGRPGALGRIPAYLAQRFPVALIEVDAETSQPRRGADGYCVRGQSGEAIGKIPAGTKLGPAAFDGYTDPAATQGKILRDVFETGDAWYRTGDVLRIDAAGFYVFVDRLGDTFRWKGENVATAEVAGVLRACPGVTDALVFGVAVPGHDGRACMAALVVGEDFDLAGLHAHVARGLPPYARPLFIRITAALEMTGTHKPVRSRLAREGFDPAVVTDPLYAADAAAGAYVPYPGGQDQAVPPASTVSVVPVTLRAPALTR